MIQKTIQKNYFRSFDELAGNPQLDQAFGEAIEHDFGAAAPSPNDGLSRRRWLQLMGASMAFGSMVGCRMGEENITPFVFRPHNRTPGVPEQFATSVDFGGIGRPLLATSVDGRPIKLDGNPDHPNCNSGSDSFTQAMILDLYDPDRSRVATMGGREVEFDELLEEASKTLNESESIAVLSEPTSSPTFNRLKAAFLDKFPKAKWYEFTSISDDNERAGTKLAFGKSFRVRNLLDKANVIVTLDADPLGVDVNASENTRRFVAGRNADGKKMNRLYSVESKFSTTGAMADHHLPLRASQISSFAVALEQAIDGGNPPSIENAQTKQEKIFAAMVGDLLDEKNKGASVIVGGYRLSPELHARICRINNKLGNLNKTVELIETADAKSSVEQISELAGEIGAAKVDTLIVVGGNPVYSAPVDLKFGEAVGRVKNSIHFGLYADETATACKSHGHLAHALEAWGDNLAADGSWLIAQPLMHPIWGAKSSLEVLGHLTGELASGHAPVESENSETHDAVHTHIGSAIDLIKATAQAAFSSSTFESDWQEAIHDGFIKNSQAKPASATLAEFESTNIDPENWKKTWEGGDLELVFVPSGSVYDGRFANNGWMQELPDFLTKLTWDNAANVSPKTARIMGLVQGKLATFDIAGSGKPVELPVNILPGMASGMVSVELGYGRTNAGRVGGNVEKGVDPVGHDIGKVRSTRNWNWIDAVSVTRSSSSYKLANTQEHFRMDNLGQNEINRRAWGDDGDAPLIREGTFDNYMDWLTKHDSGHDSNHDSHDQSADAAHAEAGHADHGVPKWPSDHHLHFKNVDITPRKYDLAQGHKWGMSIDLNKCVGCNACVIACQAENNIPIVGKEQVSRGRELHWIRIDRYFIADQDDVDAENIEVAQQPVACQHCEKAPCETVCPVAATVHSREGLNDMVYNRCIGTRYCGNNCPYKVRRFNYLNYSEERTFVKYPNEGTMSKANLQLQNLMMNPEVTVRSRGVMEKCTFCVQRIQNTKILAKKEKRDIGDNEIVTACQQACPAEAIEFGDLLVTNSRVAKAHENHRSYVLLEELNNFPRNRYLARVRNPHPKLAGMFRPWQPKS